MNGINEVTEDNHANIGYVITLFWENEKGERKITQAILPAVLKEYLKDKTVAVIGGLFLLNQQLQCDSIEQLNAFCND